LFLVSCLDVSDKNDQRHATVIQDKYILLSFENIIKLTLKKDDIPLTKLILHFFRNKQNKYDNQKSLQKNIKFSIATVKTFLKNQKNQKDKTY
jgi:hypothetical protein